MRSRIGRAGDGGPVPTPGRIGSASLVVALPLRSVGGTPIDRAIPALTSAGVRGQHRPNSSIQCDGDILGARESRVDPALHVSCGRRSEKPESVDAGRDEAAPRTAGTTRDQDQLSDKTQLNKEVRQ
jgi:hypothetical protein